MATKTESQDTRLDDDLALLAETLESVLKSSGDSADEKYVELKAKAEKSLNEVKSRLGSASDSYYARAKEVACCANDYIHDKPWHGVGVGATLGLVVGLLLTRR
ncbi:stress response protein ElaB [Erwinia tasmaniensis]|uniref:Membrane protein n=1 Tax=Erwinia tasmaniensis (strain DSM 17950 / CFBP 7177 / CIP 109463 / NCPPB 4357 / Et1/99) TaxID=465817 RepID=B2VIP0_ERWT9|nr:stress response protein ElaB [Erwinia tasmaniensis]CAO96265.1 Putative membrane protein [Erwinia tasmaniensis Et1/99]